MTRTPAESLHTPLWPISSNQHSFHSLNLPPARWRTSVSRHFCELLSDTIGSESCDFEFTFTFTHEFPCPVDDNPLGWTGGTGGVRSGESKHEAEDDSDVGTETSSSNDEGPLPSDESSSASDGYSRSLLPTRAPPCTVCALLSHVRSRARIDSPPLTSSSSTSPPTLHESDNNLPVLGSSCLRPSTPPLSKRTHSDRATDTLHVTPVKKKVKEKMEKVKSVTRSAMDLFKAPQTSPSKILALFRMKGWKNVKVSMEEEKQPAFTADSEKQRDWAEEHTKLI
ncbi:hypothetical protein K438DRAFT_1747155 [Mycena galopus ATCC 62051]|nr:hypothetical protein K438DRAFT_1747155 [Mycena galopus ATCC 62051]